MENAVQNHNKARDLAYIGLFVALIAVCSWIAIPTTVPFTLQTFAVFVSVGLLGGKRGTIAVLVYILIGAIGLPVYAGFQGGLGAVLGTTGGYLIGFIFTALVMWAMMHFLGDKTWVLIVSMVLGLLACYIIGTVWFMAVYTEASGAVAVGTVLGWCVIPFIIPDLVKIAVAVLVTKRLKKYVKA
ncbi:MAG: biotin transporter BioY [Bacillota bacterium]|jgi:biotin transport system substrate-specific component